MQRQQRKSFSDSLGNGITQKRIPSLRRSWSCLRFLLENYDGEVAINVGVGEDTAIKDLAKLIRGVVGFEGNIVWDSTKPDGTPRKLLDVSRITALGWRPEISLEDGIHSTYEWFVKSSDHERLA
jgi:GDP-L-fucose synthase